MKQQGFTLIEIMTAISVAAILGSVGLPSFKQMIDNNQSVAAANTWHAALLYARSESIKRNQRVTICQSNDGTECSSAANWGNGWIIFVDTDNSGTYTNTEELLQHAGDFAKVKLLRTSSTDNYLSYTPTGNAEATDGSPINAEWKMCLTNASTETTKIITVNNSGRAKVKKPKKNEDAACA